MTELIDRDIRYLFSVVNVNLTNLSMMKMVIDLFIIILILIGIFVYIYTPNIINTVTLSIFITLLIILYFTRFKLSNKEFKILLVKDILSMLTEYKGDNDMLKSKLIKLLSTYTHNTNNNIISMIKRRQADMILRAL